MQLADIHCHIIHGVDDGAKNLDESLRMLRMEADEGVSEIILTPHFVPMRQGNASPARIRELTERLQEAVDAEGFDIALYPGNEIFYGSDVPELLLRGKICTLADSRYVLIEFHPAETCRQIRSGLYEIISAGYRPVLAHAERYLDIVRRPERVQELTDMGVRIQINASAVMGRHMRTHTFSAHGAGLQMLSRMPDSMSYGYALRRFTGRLLKQNLVHFVASDAHDAEKRPPRLKDCLRHVAERYGRAYAESIFKKNAAEIIDEGYAGKGEDDVHLAEGDGRDGNAVKAGKEGSGRAKGSSNESTIKAGAGSPDGLERNLNEGTADAGREDSGRAERIDRRHAHPTHEKAGTQRAGEKDYGQRTAASARERS